jgi:hypothetical protein
VLKHRPYNPDLVASDCDLFGSLKDSLRGSHFANDKEVKEAVNAWLATQPKAFFILKANEACEPLD